MEGRASCYCGAVSASFDLADAFALHCHCSQCRRLSGAAFSTWLNVPRAGFRLSGAEEITAFAVTGNATRHFCRQCGSHVYSSDKREPDIFGLPLGIVEARTAPTPEVHYYFDSGVSWCDVASVARKAGGESGREPLNA